MSRRFFLFAVFVLAFAASHADAQPATLRTQVRFARPSGMKVYWQTKKDGKTVFSNIPLETPGSFNFAQGAVYQLKLTHIPGHPGLELYPTLEVVRTNPKVAEFLTHNGIPLELSDDDFSQVVAGKFVVKTVYLPFPQFQDAGGGTDTIGSTRLEPGQDPVREAARRGDIFLILRMGNIRKE
jgi:hypothetical protein